MQKDIAGIYEIKEEIGEGGGGIVYLGQHIRLKKAIVLKADKRKLNASEAVLRREVDLLKNLRQTYIPQVYDYVEEDGMVYTVMDYIEGESIDKLIARGELPSQAELVQWACQLLEALVYLHSYPPHGILHGDIKPANIMRRSNGDICLIDFNIALALGEEGAVKVGFSRGYASPEHYGADYIREKRAAAVGSNSITTNFSKKHSKKKRGKGQPEKEIQAQSETVILNETETEIIPETDLQSVTEVIPETEPCQKKKTINPAEPIKKTKAENFTGNTMTGKKLLLDARSDIYCLGATLYHLISGKRPEVDARNVVPLGKEICNDAISAILQKAMAPHPQDRYQSAQEMLDAFYQLHRTDPRAVRHKRRMIALSVVFAGIFLLGGASTLIGMKQLEQRQSALTLAEYSANALAQGDVSGAVQKALQAIPKKKSIFVAPVTAQAQKALTDALGVYDLFAGFKVLDSVGLPGAPFDFAVSPQGGQLAVVYAYEVAVYDLESQEKLVVLPMKPSAFSDCLFLDESRIVFAGEGGICAYDIDAGKTLWTGEEATILSVSADGNVVAAVNGADERVVFYRASDGEKLAERSFDGLHLSIPFNDIFADAKNYIFSLNADGSMLTVSFHNGGLYVLDQNDPMEDLILLEASDYTRFSGGFCGKYFAFTAEKSSESQFMLLDVDAAAYAGSFSSKNRMLLQADESGIYLANAGLLVQVEPDSLQEMELAHTEGAEITAFCVGGDYTLIATENKDYAFYDQGANRMSSGNVEENCEFALLAKGYALLANRNEASMRLLKLENHSEAKLFSYDARYPHDEARISADGTRVMLFSYQGFRVYDREGTLLAEQVLPDAESIYDQQFRRKDGESYLEVIWYDGTRRYYSASDGKLMREEKGEEPEKNLYEEFYTADYRVASTLHGAPEVYDISSGRLLGALESDDYLTYVTQTGEYLVAEYIATSGERYGLLLNRQLETLAYLPGLCDIVEGKTLEESVLGGAEGAVGKHTKEERETILIFDCEAGNLRQCRLYSLQELIALGETYNKP